MAAGVLAVGLGFGGAGFLNGDAAAYVAQAQQGALLERPTHLGYVLLASLLGRFAGEALPTWLDAVSALSAATLVGCLGTRGIGRALVAAAVVLPMAPFAEVDLLWIALLALSLEARPAAAALCAGLAVSVSPVALLALPWVGVARGEWRAVVGGATVAVLALTGISGFDWWVGHRGVLTSAVLMPGRALESWAIGLPWLALPLVAPTRELGVRLLATLPLLLAPPDVPTWIVPGLVLAQGLREGVGRPWAVVLLGLQVGLSGARLGSAVGEVRSEHAVLVALADELGPEDGLIARWSVGARVSFLATGDPYGLLWRSADRPVRDQAARWCRAQPDRVAVFEDGAARWEDGGPWHERFGCVGPPVVEVSDGADSDTPRRSFVPSGDPPAERLHNVVLVLGCTVRKDQVSVHGGPPDATPFLGRLAREGAVFTDLIAAAPWTRPAAAALITGRPPAALGIQEPGPGPNDRRLPDEVLTLAERLRDRGYRTLGATANPNLKAVFGFHQGFDRYIEVARLWREDGRRLTGLELVSLLDEALGELPGEGPVFLQVTLVDAHGPHPPGASSSEVPEQVAHYRDALRRLDDAVAALQNVVDRRLGPDTLFVFASDHGEGLDFPAHHGRAHGRQLAPSSVEAVWLVRGPGVGRGVRVQGLASGVDLAPTLLGHLGLPVAGMEGLDHSASLRSGGRTDRQRAFVDTWFQEVDRSAVFTPTRACQWDLGGWVAPGDPFVNGCFDRRADPLHARPFPDQALTGEILRWRRRHGAPLAPLVDLSRDSALRAELEALGYVEGDVSGGASAPSAPSAPAGPASSGASP